MHSIRIIGAGSIGNHLANAARRRGFRVILTDIDPSALERTKKQIYPSRYGSWDEEIQLMDARDAASIPADILFIGTPPDSHVAIALDVLDRVTPRILLIEKPLAGPDLAGLQALSDRAKAKGVFGAVGYNHCLGQNTRIAEASLRAKNLGAIKTISARTREHWQGIFNAHPWLAGPHESYLGFSARGGGATGEHSHAINIWQHFAHVVGAGRVTEVSAVLDIVKRETVDYDQSMFATFITKHGLVGDVIQDVVTQPPEKSARIQGESGHVEWKVNSAPGQDMVVVSEPGQEPKAEIIHKTRADDFIAEIDHLVELLAGRITDSPISLERGLDTMLVIAAIFKSHTEKRRIRIDWSGKVSPEALS